MAITRDIKKEAEEILGADLNQSLHHLIGYWYAVPTDAVFDTELACEMINQMLEQKRVLNGDN